jgi:hypothetical protein
MTPLEVARRMMRANCDPGLIVAYLRLELERDPTIGMTDQQRFAHNLRLLGEQIGRFFGDVGRGLELVGRALQSHARPLRSQYALVPPGGER